MFHFLIPAAALYGDRKVKEIAAREQELVPPFEGHIEWHHVENSGFAGGLLKDKPKTVAGIHAASCGLLACSLLQNWMEKSCVEKAGIWFILFGAASNLYDRLHHGTVTDMLRFPRAPGKLKTLIFNIADFMLFLGMILTVIGRFIRKK